MSAAWWCTAATLDACRRECSSDFVVTSRSQVFQWLKVWLAAQPEFARSSQCATGQLKEELDPGVVVKAGTQGGLGFSAAEQSTHWFRHDGTLASLALRRERVPGRQDVESLLLTLHGWPGPGAAEGRRAKLVALVEAARSLYTGQTQGRTEMFIGQAEYSGWESIGTRRSRTVASVVLPAGVADDVLADAKRFKESAGWYGDRGIPYRRGYLIHGTPGSGKTSLITAMAGELRLNICILNLSNPSLDVRSSNGTAPAIPPRPSDADRCCQQPQFPATSTPVRRSGTHSRACRSAARTSSARISSRSGSAASCWRA